MLKILKQQIRVIDLKPTGCFFDFYKEMYEFKTYFTL